MEMTWLLPDSETPVTVRMPNSKKAPSSSDLPPIQGPASIDLRVRMPQTASELRSELGSRSTSAEGQLPVVGSEASSAPVTKEFQASTPEPEQRQEKTNEARGRLKGLFRRNKSEESAEFKPESEEEVTLSPSQVRGRELYRAVGREEDAKRERGRELYKAENAEAKKQQDRGKALYDARAAELKASQDRGKAAIEAQLQRGKEALDGPMSPELNDFTERVREYFADARSMEELREKAQAMTGPNGYLVAVSGNKIFQTVDKEFKAVEPSDPNKPRLPGKLAMKELEEAVWNIQQRGDIRRAGGRFSLLRERQEKASNERTKAEEARQAVEIANFQAKLVDLPSFDDFVKAKKAEARKPIDKQIKRLQNVELPKLEARKAKRVATRSDWVDAVAHTDEQIQSVNDRITELQKLAQQAEIDAETAANEEKDGISDKAVKKSDKALDLVEGTKSGRVNFSPKSGQDSDMSLVIADVIGESVGKKVEANGLPFQVNEYKLNGARMQRLVYKTDYRDTVIVEEWNKDTGTLKRQTVLKDKNVLITGSENDGVSRVRAAARRRNGNERQVLNDALYGEDEKLVKAAQGWSEGGGDSGSYGIDDAVRYASRLDRSGISGRGKYEMASDKYKTKNSKGTKSFIKMLQDSLVGGGKK